MSGPGFTPGPWRVQLDSGTWEVCPEGESCAPIALVPVLPRDEEEEANAHLIASAPALYALVETIADAASDAMEDGVLEAWALETVRRCQAALASARGEPCE